METIDFVVTWVDGNDPAWRAQRSKFLPDQTNSGNTENRYRDWELMRYWFRGVEKFAPWVHKVYFITCGQTPDWLDLAHPKLVHVKHKDYIPAELLPTFNSVVIENHLHRLPELSEHFVLFNDDVFLTGPVTKDDFFRNGKPCDAALLGLLSSTDPDDIFPFSLLNNAAIINKHFSKREVLRKNWKCFFAPVYGAQMIRNLLLLPFKNFSCFNDGHITSPYLKSTFSKVWEAEPDRLLLGSSSRMRSKDDVNHWLMKAWQICEGNTFPRSTKMGKCFEIGRDKEAACAVMRQKYKVVCLNDSAVDIDFEGEKRRFISAFDSILPDKSSFEL